MPTFQVNLTEVSDRAWFALRKALRMVAGLGWLDARRLSRYVLAVDRNTEQYLHLPCVLVAGIDRATADHVAGLLRQAGATVSVEESTLQQPMLLCPKVNQRYRWDNLLAKPVVDQPLSARRVARHVVWTALCVACILAVIAGVGVETTPAEGSKLIWVTNWSLYGAVLGAVYGAIWGLLKAIGRLSVWLQAILWFSCGMALKAALHTNKPYPSQGFSIDSALGRTVFGAILGAVAGAVIWFGVWLLRRMCLALLHVFRGGRTA
jgi:hypothetical protein